MGAASDFVAAAWRGGLGPEDTVAVAELSKLHPTDGMVAMFATWSRILADQRSDLPPPPSDAAAGVVHASAVVADAALGSEVAKIDAALRGLDTALSALTADHPFATAARAWADLALARLALRLGDVATARRRYEDVANPGRPIALRITAMLALASLAMERVNVEPARNWARKANALAEAHRRPLQAARARLLWGLLDYAAGDLSAMRKTLGTLIQRGEGGAVARLLLANAERGGRAMELLAEGIRDAVEHRDPLAYVLCVLVGSRRYVGMKREVDALVTITAGIVELGKVAPILADVLVRERDEWKRVWGDARYAAAEQAGLKLLA